MIEELQRFIQVANEGNFTRTAEKIFITQSALTQSIKRLEKTIGAKLLVQKGKYMNLTPDGKAVYSLATKILKLWASAKDSKIRSNLLPNFTIGAFDNAALRLGSYFKNNINSGNFQLELIIDTSDKLITDLKLGIIDAALCAIDKKNPPPKDILLIETFEEELIPVSSVRFNKPLEKVPFILYNKGSKTREQIDSVFTKNGIVPEIFAQSSSVTFMRELATLGCGVALLPENFIRSEIKQGILRRQKIPIIFKREYGIYIQEDGKLQKDHELIRGIIKSLRKK